MTKQQRRWQSELNGGILNWKKIYSHVYSITSDFELRWFQYRLLQRILPTNRLLYLYRLVDKDECTFCPGIPETNIHAFWHCRQTKNFWVQFKTLLGLREELDLKTIITGICRQQEEFSPQAIALCILLAKRYLWRSRKAARSPNVLGFVPTLIGYIRVERYVAAIEGKVEGFLALWSSILERIGIG